MQRIKTAAYDAWLLCWGFVEITDWDGGPKAEATFSELMQSATYMFINGRDADDGTEITFVFDPSTARSWARHGFVELEHPPFNFENRTAEAVLSERRKRTGK
jgi:hypothetical protein